MKIIIKAKNLNLSGALQNYINEKIGSLKKFINILKREDEIGKTLAEVYVEVEKETEHHKKGQIFSCQLEVKLPGKSLVAKSESDDLYKAIVSAKKELEQAIKKYKVKKVEFSRRIAKKTKRDIKI